MRKIAMLAVLGLVLSACASGTSIGSGVDTGVGTEIPPSESPSPKKTKRKPPKPSPTPTKSAAPTPTFTGAVYTIIIRGTNNFYEYKGPGFDYREADTGGPVVFQNDVIVFKNRDKRGLKHSWTSGSPSASDFGEVFDSGLLKPGQDFRWEVTAPPGQYAYADANIQYIIGGPLRIERRP